MPCNYVHFICSLIVLLYERLLNNVHEIYFEMSFFLSFVRVESRFDKFSNCVGKHLKLVFSILDGVIFWLKHVKNPAKMPFTNNCFFSFYLLETSICIILTNSFFSYAILPDIGVIYCANGTRYLAWNFPVLSWKSAR